MENKKRTLSEIVGTGLRDLGILTRRAFNPFYSGYESDYKKMTSREKQEELTRLTSLNPPGKEDTKYYLKALSFISKMSPEEKAKFFKTQGPNLISFKTHKEAERWVEGDFKNRYGTRYTLNSDPNTAYEHGMPVSVLYGFEDWENPK